MAINVRISRYRGSVGLPLLVTFKNNCGSSVKPVIANVNCGYSPRCSTPGSGGVVRHLSLCCAIHLTPTPCTPLKPNPAISYTGPQPNSLGPGASQTLTINSQVGQFLVQRFGQRIKFHLVEWSYFQPKRSMWSQWRKLYYHRI